jgi:hypothetical protein
LSVPSDDGVGLDEGERLSPVGPETGQNNPKGSAPIGQAGPFGVPLQDIELMTKRKVFQDQCASGLQSGDQPAEKDECHESYDIMKSS